MLFNSFAFFVFFPATAAGYFILPHRWRWLWLLAASCIFYGLFMPILLLIAGGVIGVGYVSGHLVERATGGWRHGLLAAGIVANLAILATFKYGSNLGIHLESLAGLPSWDFPLYVLGLAAPAGLSFQVLQTVGYMIEVHGARQTAERHAGIFALHVLFFPRVMCGPLERPQSLLPQFRVFHSFNYDRVTDGLRLIAWGLFKKAVVADRLALAVDNVYADPTKFGGPPLALATILFGFQLYLDFSGYTDIALGSARVLGFNLTRNFDRPYGARNLADFWRRWHISLSTWLRDHIYIPLGGNRVSVTRWYFNLLIVFLVSGLWHGMQVTFILCAVWQGLMLVVDLGTRPLRDRLATALGVAENSALRLACQIVVTFAVVDFGWIFFRARSVHDAWAVISHLPTGWTALRSVGALYDVANTAGLTPVGIVIGIGGIVLVERVQWLQVRRPLIVAVKSWRGWQRWSLYYAAAAALFFLWIDESSPFIYVKF